MDLAPLYRRIVENLPHGLAVWSAESDDPGDLRLVHATAQATRQSGLDLGALVGRTFREAFPAVQVPGPDGSIPRATHTVAVSQHPHTMEELACGDPRRPEIFRVHMIPAGDWPNGCAPDGRR